MTDAQKYDKASQLADDLPPEQAAKLAGEILEAAGVSRSHVELFLTELGDSHGFAQLVHGIVKECR